MRNRNFFRAMRDLEEAKSDQQIQIPGILGFMLNGANTVEVPTRMGFVYVRLRNSTSEVIQAYNDQVAPVYGLPVLVVRDEVDTSKYRILGRDVGVYQNWGSSSSYLPKHGHSHSFIPEEGGGGDVVWTYSRQIMPLAAYPSGSAGSNGVIIKPSTYYQDDTWKYAGNTGSPDLLAYKPTDNKAKMVLLYMDSNGNPQVQDTVTTFAESITGTAGILQFIPKVSSTYTVPIAGIRLVSGTQTILWDNIYDLRPFIVADGFIPTGSFATFNHTHGVTGSGVIGFFYGGDLAVGTLPVRNLAPRDGTIENVTASVYSAPTGSSIILDVEKNASSIYAILANKPTILSGNYKDLISLPSVTSFSKDDEFTLLVEQIGVSGSGANIEVQMRYRYNGIC
jgi:hypothetical protein